MSIQEYQIIDDKFVITTDTTDWYNELMQVDPDIETVDAAIETMLKENRHPAQMGRMALIAELLGMTTEEIVGMPKPLLQTAVAQAFQSQIARRKTSFETANGKSVNVREFVAPVGEYDEESGETEPTDENHVRYNDPRALEYAIKYLRNRVPGYIKGRLNLIAANGGDVQQAADELKMTIDEMVQSLK